MRISYSDSFLRQFTAAPPVVQKAFGKQVELLLRDLRHPSLRAKKLSGAAGLWQARVNRDWRIFFTVSGSECRLHAITPHPK